MALIRIRRRIAGITRVTPSLQMLPQLLIAMMCSIFFRVRACRRPQLSADSRRRLGYFMVLTISVGLVLYHHLQPFHNRMPLEAIVFYQDFWEEPLDKDQACQIPSIHPFDETILPYLATPRPIRCNARQPMLTYIDLQGYLRFNMTAAEQAGYDTSTLMCEYQEFHRSKTDDNEVIKKPVYRMTGKDYLHNDFVSIWCKNFVGILFYTNTHAHIHKVPNVKVRHKSDLSKLSVFIFGIDSTSRLNFMRQLPRTYQYLTQNMGSYDFRGFTKVGENTFPNLIPLLTGRIPVFTSYPAYKAAGFKEEELIHVPEGLNRTYDDWPLVWKNLPKDYITLLAEDNPFVSLFNYEAEGFRMQPTTHYMRPYWRTLEFSKLHLLSSPLCLGPIPKHKLTLNYYLEFIKKYHKNSYFGFSFLSELSHDYLNQIAVLDEDLKTFLQSAFEGGYLNNTIFITMSDHGHRYNAIRSTLVGRIEERMPVLTFYVPSWLQRTHLDIAMNLQKNAKRLTSILDLHTTLLDIAAYSSGSSALGHFKEARGHSIFGDIPSSRTCNMAGIPENYCICESEESISLSDHSVRKAAEVTVKKLQELVEKYSYYCSSLQLRAVKMAHKIVQRREVLIDKIQSLGGTVYESDELSDVKTKIRVVVEMVPGSGLFEALAVFNNDLNPVVVGDISRINEYGKQPACLPKEILAANDGLRKYCYCVR